MDQEDLCRLPTTTTPSLDFDELCRQRVCANGGFWDGACDVDGGGFAVVTA